MHNSLCIARNRIIISPKLCPSTSSYPHRRHAIELSRIFSSTSELASPTVLSFNLVFLSAAFFFFFFSHYIHYSSIQPKPPHRLQQSTWPTTSHPFSAPSKTRSIVPSTTKSAPADTATGARGNMSSHPTRRPS